MLAVEKRLLLFSAWWKTAGGLCLVVALASGCSKSFEAKRPDDSGQASEQTANEQSDGTVMLDRVQSAGDTDGIPGADASPRQESAAMISVSTLY